MKLQILRLTEGADGELQQDNQDNHRNTLLPLLAGMRYVGPALCGRILREAEFLCRSKRPALPHKCGFDKSQIAQTYSYVSPAERLLARRSVARAGGDEFEAALHRDLGYQLVNGPKNGVVAQRVQQGLPKLPKGLPPAMPPPPPLPAPPPPSAGGAAGGTNAPALPSGLPPDVSPVAANTTATALPTGGPPSRPPPDAADPETHYHAVVGEMVRRPPGAVPTGCAAPLLAVCAPALY